MWNTLIFKWVADQKNIHSKVIINSFPSFLWGFASYDPYWLLCPNSIQGPMLLDWIPLANWFLGEPVKHVFQNISVSESDLQKISSPQFTVEYSINHISKPKQKTRELKNLFQIIEKLLRLGKKNWQKFLQQFFLMFYIVWNICKIYLTTSEGRGSACHWLG